MEKVTKYCKKMHEILFTFSRVHRLITYLYDLLTVWVINKSAHVVFYQTLAFSCNLLTTRFMSTLAFEVLKEICPRVFLSNFGIFTEKFKQICQPHGILSNSGIFNNNLSNVIIIYLAWHVCASLKSHLFFCLFLQRRMFAMSQLANKIYIAWGTNLNMFHKS